jgi:peptide/nickel transport system substrate-binding protein
MKIGAGLGSVIVTALAIVAAANAVADETPKHGGTLTYLIPTDAPPSFDGHREWTFATAHTATPFYSLLIEVNPEDLSSTTDFVCDLCTEMPKPTDNGTTYTFKIRQGVKFHDGTAMTAADVVASWNKIVFPPPGVISTRQSNYSMIDRIEAPDASTVVFHLKFPTTAFLPALADPMSWIYEKAILDKDPHWYEKNIMGSGPFKFAGYEAGQFIKGVKNPDYYRPGLPYLDGFTGIYADKQAVRVDALRADRATIEFRGLPPNARDELKQSLGDRITVQESDWNCSNLITPNHARKPFDDVRVRRALTLALDRWHGAPGLAKIAVMRTVGGAVFPGSPLAATQQELGQLAGFWADIEKSRAEARRLLKEAGAENLKFELLNRTVDQPFKYLGAWLVDEWSKIGLQVTQRVAPTGPWIESMRTGNFDVTIEGGCGDLVNPLVDTSKYLPHSANPENYGNYDDPAEVALYDKMLREPDPTKQRALMRQFEKYVMDDQAHELMTLWWYRIVPYRAYVKGWNIGPSHFLGNNLATVWLDK